MSHPCPRPGCPVTVADDRRLLCRMCWSVVPQPMRRAVYIAFDCGRGLGTDALRAAQEAAISAAVRALQPETT